MTSQDVADLLRLHPQIVNRKAHNGELKAYRLENGNKWLFDPADIKAALVPNVKGKR
jgi:excisionase family DNA binding protein